MISWFATKAFHLSRRLRLGSLGAAFLVAAPALREAADDAGRAAEEEAVLPAAGLAPPAAGLAEAPPRAEEAEDRLGLSSSSSE
jgi:hypothetical protein